MSMYIYIHIYIDTPIMELGSQNHNGDGLSGPNSKMVVYMDPLGNGYVIQIKVWRFTPTRCTPKS